MPLRILASGLIAALLALPALAPCPAGAQEVTRRLSHVTGDVWRFQNKFHYSVVIDTAEGVVVTDPIHHSAARWLHEIIASRFAKPIIYLVYSHSHDDHAAGGEIFARTATVIAHENAPPSIFGVTPEIRFSERMSFTAGAHTFELTYLGPGHGPDLIAMVIRPENVAFVVDAVTPGRLPFRDFPDEDIAGLIEQIKVVETLDFDILAPGHSRLGTKAEVTEHREYIEWLRDSVAAELRAGKTPDEIVESLDTSRYESLMAYDIWRDDNIIGMARWLQETGRTD